MTEPVLATADPATSQRRTIIALLAVLITAVVVAVVICLVATASAAQQAEQDACRASATNLVDRFLCE